MSRSRSAHRIGITFATVSNRTIGSPSFDFVIIRSTRPMVDHVTAVMRLRSPAKLRLARTARLSSIAIGSKICCRWGRGRTDLSARRGADRERYFTEAPHRPLSERDRPDRSARISLCAARPYRVQRGVDLSNRGACWRGLCRRRQRLRFEHAGTDTCGCVGRIRTNCRSGARLD